MANCNDKNLIIFFAGQYAENIFSDLEVLFEDSFTNFLACFTILDTACWSRVLGLLLRCVATK